MEFRQAVPHLGISQLTLRRRISPKLPCTRQTVESEGSQDGDAVVSDITPLQGVPIDEVLEDFQRYSQGKNGEGPEDLLTAGTRQEEQQECSSSERQPMDFPVVAGDHAGPGRLEGTDNQEGNPEGGDDAEDTRM